MEEIRAASGEIERRGRRVLSAKDAGIADGDPPGLRAQIVYLLTEWIKCLRTTGENGYPQWLVLLQSSGAMKGDDLAARGLRVFVELCMERCYAEQQAQRPMTFEYFDAFAKMIQLLVRQTPETNALGRVNIVVKVPLWKPLCCFVFCCLYCCCSAIVVLCVWTMITNY